MEFEWDEQKEITNIKKHHISFNIAKQVFNDMNRIEVYDMQHSLEEDRYNTIGMVEDVLFVVHTEKREKIRFISVRLATEKEMSIMITATLSKDEKLTDEDRKMLEAAGKYPITFDEDSPELTPEMEKAFRSAAKTRNRLRA